MDRKEREDIYIMMEVTYTYKNPHIWMYMHIHGMSACHMYGYVYFDLTMDIFGGVRPRTGNLSFQASLGSGATQTAKPSANDVRQIIVINNLKKIHHPTDSGTVKEAAEASWKGFKPGRP